MDFSVTLNSILNESDNPATSLADASMLIKQLEYARRVVLELQHKILLLRNKINSQLALAIRKKSPALNISIDRNGNLKIGYKAKSLTFSPDLENGIWQVESLDHRFVNRFTRNNRSKLIIGSDVHELIDAIINFYINHYKSLGEDIIGTGCVLIDGKSSTLSDLINWRESKIVEPLKSRSITKHAKQ